MERQTVDDNLELAGEGIHLRPWHPSHANALHEAAAASASSVGRWLPWCRADYSLDDARNWVEHCRLGWLAGEQFAFGIFDAVEHTLLGGVGFSRVEALHRTANLGYWIRTSQQRKGIAVRASRRLLAFGFSQLGLARVEIVALPENLASAKTALRLGAKFEGTARQRLRVDGSSHDASIYGLVAADPAAPVIEGN